MTTLALVRHGRTEWNALNRFQGQVDIPLDDEGRAQAARTAEALVSFPAGRLVASPLGRAQETARIIGARLELPEPEIVPEVIERGYGPFEGASVFETLATHPDHYYPGAEPEEAVAERGAKALRTLLADERDAVVVTHGTLLRLALGTLTDNPHFHRFGNADVVLLSDDHDGSPLRAEWFVGPTSIDA